MHGCSAFFHALIGKNFLRLWICYRLFDNALGGIKSDKLLKLAVGRAFYLLGFFPVIELFEVWILGIDFCFQDIWIPSIVHTHKLACSIWGILCAQGKEVFIAGGILFSAKLSEIFMCIFVFYSIVRKLHECDSAELFFHSVRERRSVIWKGKNKLYLVFVGIDEVKYNIGDSFIGCTIIAVGTL